MNGFHDDWNRATSSAVVFTWSAVPGRFVPMPTLPEKEAFPVAASMERA